MKSVPYALIALVVAAGCSRAGKEPTADPTAAPSASASMADFPSRYQQVPARGLLENYVLSTIGELTIPREKATAAFVNKEMGHDPNWRTTVRKQLQWKDSVDGFIRTAWDEYRAKHGTAGHPASGEEFARRFVDEVFLQHAPPAGEAQIVSPEAAKAARAFATAPQALELRPAAPGTHPSGPGSASPVVGAVPTLVGAAPAGSAVAAVRKSGPSIVAGPARSPDSAPESH